MEGGVVVGGGGCDALLTRTPLVMIRFSRTSHAFHRANDAWVVRLRGP